MVDITIARLERYGRGHATAVTIGSVYELEYVATLASDLITAKFS